MQWEKVIYKKGSRKHPCGASSEEGVNWAVFYENFKTKLGRDGPVTGHGCLWEFLHHKQGLTELNTYPSGRKEGIECIMTFIL